MPQTKAPPNATPSVTLAQLRSLTKGRPTNFSHSLEMARQQADLLRGNSDTTPVAIEAITELPRIRIENDAEQRLPSIGFWDTSTRQWVIQLPYADKWNDQRYSIAREFKRILDCEHAAHLYPGSGTVSSRYQADHATDHFASHLLVPDHLLRRAWHDGTRTVAELAATFAVPTSAIHQRLSDTKLIAATHEHPEPGGRRSA